MISVVNRRRFTKVLAAMSTGIGLRTMNAGAAKRSSRENTRNYNPAMAYRELGDTGIRVSVFSLGTGTCNPEVLKEGVKLGINLIHTSTQYEGGETIKKLRGVLEGGVREKVYLALKDNFDSLEQVLNDLGIDYVDLIMFNRHDPASLKVDLPTIEKKFLRWRDDGMVGCAGLTTHGSMAECVDLAAAAGFFSVVMPSYGPKQVEDFGPQRKVLRSKKMSIIAMKTRGELEGGAYEKQIPRVLADPVVSTLLKGTGSIENLKRWSTVAAEARTGMIPRIFDTDNRYAYGYAGCMMCGECGKACPRRIDTAGIVRCTRYYNDAEHSPDQAVRTFREIGGATAVASCSDCGACERACPQRINVRGEMKKAAALWA